MPCPDQSFQNRDRNWPRVRLGVNWNPLVNWFLNRFTEKKNMKILILNLDRNSHSSSLNTEGTMTIEHPCLRSHNIHEILKM